MSTGAMSVDFRDVVYEVPSPKRGGAPLRILHGVSGHVREGESLAVLGPSGSGKTTLLNLLAGRSMHGLSGGRILFGGAERTARTKRSIGYVMQDDLFFSRLTVRETLQFTADLRLPSSVSAADKTARIDAMIESLRLNRCQNTHIGDQMFRKGISGGERKRLNIANELVPNPALLLGDECTSGLDSSSAFTVVELLKQLSRQGKTVICTIHQPSSQMFHLFDKVLLLSSGRVAYFGTPEGASSYFSSIGYPFPSSMYNPADAMLELIIDDLPPNGTQTNDEEAGLSPQQLAKKRILAAWEQHGPNLYKTPKPKAIEGDINAPEQRQHTSESSSVGMSGGDEVPPPPQVKKGPVRAVQKRYWAATGQRDHDPLPHKYPATFWRQVVALGKRTMRQKRGNMLERIQIIQVAAVTTMCLLFWLRIKPVETTIQDRLGALFFFNVFWAFFSVFQALYTFPAERAVLNKDRASGAYRLSAYYLAKTSVEIPADIFYPVIFVCITYFAVGFNPTPGAFFLHTLTIILSVISSLSLGVLISAVLVDVKEAQVLASVLILCSMLIGGYYISSENVPVFLRPFRHLSYLKYSYESMVRIEAKGQTFKCVDPALGEAHTIYSQNGRACPVDEKALLHGAQLDDNVGIAGNLAILLAWIVVLRLLGYFALKYLNRRHKPKRQRNAKKTEAPTKEEFVETVTKE